MIDALPLTPAAERRPSSDPSRERRMKIAVLAQETLPLILTGRVRWTGTELPDDAEVVSVHYDPNRRSFLVCIVSETYAPIFSGVLLPEMEFYLEEVRE
jgi:hypothetical protein